MTILAAIASIGLIIISVIHVVWAIGFWWPIRDEAALARAVIGTKSVDKMPGAVTCSLVAVALLFAATWPWFGDGPLKPMGLFGIALIFQIRAIAAYSTLMKRLAPEQPFRRLDEAY
jgi:hypothetical protein